jgi:hypothetical protein
MSDRPTREAMSPETEIEVTPEMVEAGVAEISNYNLDFETREEAVMRIFTAMILVCNRD